MYVRMCLHVSHRKDLGATMFLRRYAHFGSFETVSPVNLELEELV